MARWCVEERLSGLWDVCNFKKGVPTWSETITFCTSIHSWLVFDLGRDEWVIWRMATVGIPLCRRDGRYVRRSADGLLERREDWDRKQGRRWHTEELLKEFTGRYEQPPGPRFVFLKRFTESFYIWLLDGDWSSEAFKERERRKREREREMNRWSGLRAEPVYSVTISMWVQYGTVETISAAPDLHWTHKHSHRLALKTNMQHRLSGYKVKLLLFTTVIL